MNPNHRSSTFSRSRDMHIPTACAIIHRDGYKCAYCDKAGLVIKTNDATIRAELDHLIPRKDGGRAIPTNLVTSCGDCNRKRQSHKIHPRRILDAVGQAQKPIDRAIGRELAMAHYPSRMKPRKRNIEVRA
jgi:5-methylcytosine-specific restriction endonuclease McrA